MLYNIINERAYIIRIKHKLMGKVDNTRIYMYALKNVSNYTKVIGGV